MKMGVKIYIYIIEHELILRGFMLRENNRFEFMSKSKIAVNYHSKTKLHGLANITKARLYHN